MDGQKDSWVDRWIIRQKRALPHTHMHIPLIHMHTQTLTYMCTHHTENYITSGGFSIIIKNFHLKKKICLWGRGNRTFLGRPERKHLRIYILRMLKEGGRKQDSENYIRVCCFLGFLFLFHSEPAKTKCVVLELKPSSWSAWRCHPTLLDISARTDKYNRQFAPWL